MPSIYSKNCILTGVIDYYCLICVQPFRNEKETLAHICDSQHESKIKLTGYLEKYKEDGIKNVKELYFCELCNATFPTTAKVELHVAEESHIANRNSVTKVIRLKDDIVAFGHVMITDEAWNGFVEETCVLCNVEYDDSAAHKSELNHVLNLIRSDVTFDADETIFRKIDANFFQCLTCNIMLPINELTLHFQSAQHKDNYKTYNPEHNDVEHTRADGIQTLNCSENGDDAKTFKVKKGNNEKEKVEEVDDTHISQKTRDVNEIYCKKLGAKNFLVEMNGILNCILCDTMINESSEDHLNSKHHQTILEMHEERSTKDEKNELAAKSKVSDFIDRYQNQNVNVNLINETATCKKCLKNIDYNIDAIESHINKHKSSNDKSKDNVVSFPSGTKSNGSDKTKLYSKPVRLATDKENQHTRIKLPATQAASLEDFARQHGLAPNRADKSFYCRPCCRRLRATYEELETHVTSNKHKEKISIAARKSQLLNTAHKKNISTYTFLKKIAFLESVDRFDICINDRYFINCYGFILIGKYGNSLICHACDIYLQPENVFLHIATQPHADVIQKSLVISSLENEFIREIKHEIYHCGYCNIVEQDWEDMLEHLETEAHKIEKSNAESALRINRSKFYNVNLDDMPNLFGSFMSVHSSKMF